jgi:hypothetical protein
VLKLLLLGKLLGRSSVVFPLPAPAPQSWLSNSPLSLLTVAPRSAPATFFPHRAEELRINQELDEFDRLMAERERERRRGGTR